MWGSLSDACHMAGIPDIGYSDGENDSPSLQPNSDPAQWRSDYRRVTPTILQLQM